MSTVSLEKQDCCFALMRAAQSTLVHYLRNEFQFRALGLLSSSWLYFHVLEIKFISKLEGLMCVELK